MATTHTRVAVDCHVRPSLFVEPVDETIETLREYDERKVVDDLAIEPWPDSVRLGDSGGNEGFRECYEEFRRWADGRDVSLEPGFLRRQQTTLVSEGRDTILTPPVVCLAVHVDGELASVAPHNTGTTVYTVEDALADIAGFADDPPEVRPPVPTGTNK